jgi:hypothetical protein
VLGLLASVRRGVAHRAHRACILVKVKPRQLSSQPAWDRQNEARAIAAQSAPSAGPRGLTKFVLPVAVGYPLMPRRSLSIVCTASYFAVDGSGELAM